jgi:HK97 family phage major capsid protein
VIQRATVIPGGAGVTGFAEELVQINQANEAFIELLRPMSVLANFPGRPMSFDGAGSIKIPRQTVGSTGGWIGEGGAIKVDRLTLDSVELTPKKNANIIAVSNELLARSTPSAMAIIRDDILRGIATSIDTKFLSSDAASAGVSPAGIQTYDGSSTASAGDTLDNITTDLKAAIAAMLTVNMPMARPIWLINPIRLNALKFIRDGLGAYAFKDEINQGTLAGYPYLTSTSVTDSVVMLVDAAQVIIATELAPEISISQDATIHMSDGPDADIGGGGSATPVQSMFQTDSTAVKAITRLDFAARYAECTQVITGVSWA